MIFGRGRLMCFLKDLGTEGFLIRLWTWRKSGRTHHDNLRMVFFETQADRPDNRSEAYDFERGK